MREHAGFVAVVGAAPIVVGGILITVGVSQATAAGSEALNAGSEALNLWGNGWFVAGIVAVAVGVVVEALAVVLYVRRPAPIAAMAGTPATQAVEATSHAVEALLRRTPEELWGMREGLTDMQADSVIKPLLGQRLQVTGTVDSVGAWTGTFAYVTFRFNPKEGFRAIFMTFEDETLVPRLAELTKGDQITVRGTLTGVSGHGIQLENCELVGS